MTARISPWKSGSMNLVRLRNARAQEGSRCSSTDSRCESAYEMVLTIPLINISSFKLTQDNLHL